MFSIIDSAIKKFLKKFDKKYFLYWLVTRIIAVLCVIILLFLSIFLVFRIHYGLSGFLIFCWIFISKCFGNSYYTSLFQADYEIFLYYKPSIPYNCITHFYNLYHLVCSSQISILGRFIIISSFIFVCTIFYVITYCHIRWSYAHKYFEHGDGIRVIVYLIICHVFAISMIAIVFWFFKWNWCIFEFGIDVVLIYSIIFYTIFLIHLYTLFYKHNFIWKSELVADSFVFFYIWHLLNLLLSFFFALTQFSIFFLPLYVIVLILCIYIRKAALIKAFEDREDCPDTYV